MGISKIARNFQVTLPKDIRELRDFKIGDKVLFITENDRIEIVKLDKNIIKNAAGLWSDIKETGQEYEKRLRKEWEKREF